MCLCSHFNFKGKGHAKPDAPPPYEEPYSKSQQSHDEPVPDYQEPHFPSAGDSTIVPATRRFPPTLNAYTKWTSSTFHLGPSAEHKLFAVTCGKGWTTYTPELTIHSGPDKHDPVLAVASGMKATKRSMDCTVTVPASITGAAPVQTNAAYKFTSWKDMQYAFSVAVPPLPGYEKQGPQLETYEWRTTHGNEVRELCGGSYTSGWKLVRMTGGPVGGGGPRAERGIGSTSDGYEVVAVLAQNSSWSMTKGMRFAFLGTGLTGTFGDLWETVTVATGLQLWYMSIMNAAVAASS